MLKMSEVGVSADTLGAGEVVLYALSHPFSVGIKLVSAVPLTPSRGILRHNGQAIDTVILIRLRGDQGVNLLLRQIAVVVLARRGRRKRPEL
jgi:hypothetical protein